MVDEKHRTANNIGFLEPLASWNPEIVQLRWQVRWTAKGLMPVKPVLHLAGSLTLPAGHACRCSVVPLSTDPPS